MEMTFIHSFNKYLLSTYNMPATILGAGMTISYLVLKQISLGSVDNDLG